MKRLFLLLFLIPFFVSCESTTNKGNNYHVIVSVLPQKYFIDKISSGKISALVMVPSAASPATYEPTPGQIRQIRDMKTYLQIGYLGFETSWLERIREANPKMEIINVSKGIDLIKGTHDHGKDDENEVTSGIDPHVWMSPKNCILISKNILKVLIDMDPGNKELFEKNYLKLVKQITDLDSTIINELHTFGNRYFLIFHPALTYYAKDYSLQQISIEDDGKEPSVKHMAEVMKLTKEKKIQDIFIQREFDSEYAEIIALETGGDIIVIDPLAYDWQEQLLFITNKMKIILEKQNE